MGGVEGTEVTVLSPLIPTNEGRGLPRKEKTWDNPNKSKKILPEKEYPMSNDTVFSPAKASGSVHEQIESFLQTVMKGLMRSQDAAADQVGKAGRPVYLPSVALWMAVLVAILRGLKSQRAPWRFFPARPSFKQQTHHIVD